MPIGPSRTLAREGAGITLYLNELNDRQPFKAAAPPLEEASG